MMGIITTHNILKGFSLFSCADILFLNYWSPKALNFVPRVCLPPCRGSGA